MSLQLSKPTDSDVISCDQLQPLSATKSVTSHFTNSHTQITKFKTLGLKKKSMSMSNKKKTFISITISIFPYSDITKFKSTRNIIKLCKKKKIIWKTSPSLSHTLITKCLSWCLPGQFSILFPPLLSLVCLLVGLVAQLQQWLTYVIIINSGLHLPSARLFCQV